MKSHFEVLEVVVPSETDFPAEGMGYTKARGIKLGLLGTAEYFMIGVRGALGESLR